MDSEQRPKRFHLDFGIVGELNSIQKVKHNAKHK